MIPAAVVLTSLFNLGLNLVVVVVFLLFGGVTPMWTWLLFPIVLVLLFVLTMAVSMIVSSLYPRFRDTAIIWTVFATALFYVTPVLYPVEVVPHTLRQLFLLNPLAPLFELARKWVIDPHAPGPIAAAGGVAELAAPIAIYVTICVLGGVALPARGAADRRAAVTGDVHTSTGPRRAGHGVMVRVAVVLVAILVLAWLGVMERDTRLRSDASKALGNARFARAEADLREPVSSIPTPHRTFFGPRSTWAAASGTVRPPRSSTCSAASRENLTAWRYLVLISGVR